MYTSYHTQRMAEMTKVLRGWIFRTIKSIASEAQKRAPRAAGNLANSILVYFRSQYVGVVTVNAPYARFVAGYPQITKRHFVPWSVSYTFKAWGSRRGFNVDRGGILVWGYRVPFFQQAIGVVKPRAMLELRRMRT